MSLMVGLAPISVCGQMSGPVRYDALLENPQEYFESPVKEFRAQDLQKS